VSCRAIAIAALVPRQRAVVAGVVESVESHQRPWIWTDATLGDGSATLVLRFMGRARVPGLAAGIRVVAEGTPAFERGVLLMRNPIYSLGTGS
jgi:hypothetical protein